MKLARALPTPAAVTSLGDGPVPYDDLPLGSRHCFALTAGTMADGTELTLPVLVAPGASRAPRLVCVAGIHGNEPEGITALLELWDEIGPGELAGTLVLVPVANPPAFRAGERRNPEDPLDMNRSFPGAPGRHDHRAAGPSPLPRRRSRRRFRPFAARLGAWRAGRPLHRISARHTRDGELSRRRARVWSRVDRGVRLAIRDARRCLRAEQHPRHRTGDRWSGDHGVRAPDTLQAMRSQLDDASGVVVWSA